MIFLYKLILSYQIIRRLCLDLWQNGMKYGLQHASHREGLSILKFFYTGNNYHLQSLRYLALTDSNITMLCHVLASNPSFQALRDTSIRGANIQVVTANASLILLDLSSSQPNHNDLAILAANKTLKYLNLCATNIGDAGTQIIAKNTTLIGLDISNSGVGDAGALALAANRTLQRLRLVNNKISPIGSTALALNKTLTELDISGFNRIDDATAHAFIKNASLKKLKPPLSIPPELYVLINKSVKRNNHHFLKLCVFSSILNGANRPIPFDIFFSIGSFLMADHWALKIGRLTETRKAPANPIHSMSIFSFNKPENKVIEKIRGPNINSIEMHLELQTAAPSPAHYPSA